MAGCDPSITTKATRRSTQRYRLLPEVSARVRFLVEVKMSWKLLGSSSNSDTGARAPTCAEMNSRDFCMAFDAPTGFRPTLNMPMMPAGTNHRGTGATQGHKTVVRNKQDRTKQQQQQQKRRKDKQRSATVCNRAQPRARTCKQNKHTTAHETTARPHAHTHLLPSCPPTQMLCPDARGGQRIFPAAGIG